MVERWRGLAGAAIDLDELDGPATVAAAVDDMLDAAVAAWTAGRLAGGTARPFPGSPPHDPDGRMVAIWA